MGNEDPRRARAVELRQAGWTIAAIQAELRVGTRSMTTWLAGVEKPFGIHRTHHKDELRARAVDLRELGWSYSQIQAELGVSKSSLSLWLRDVLLTRSQQKELDSRRLLGVSTRAASIRAGRIRRTEMLQAAAAAEIGDLTERELFLLGVVAYWCEGAKEKPWSPKGRVSFINSDAELVALFCTWLRLVGIADEDRVFRLAIHERADIEAAQRFWRGIVGGREDQWRRPTLKKHRPKTVRHNTGAEYVGCLVIEVRRSTELNRRIAGWWRGIAATSPFLRPVP